MGISTVKLLQLLDKTLFTPNTTSVILAHDRESVEKLFRVIQFAFEHFGEDYGIPKPEPKYDNKNELFFAETNSTIYVALQIRGNTVQNLHVSELAFMENAEDRMVATFASVSPDGNITIETTPNGIGNYFFDFYSTATERGFRPHFYPWFFSDEYRVKVPEGTEFSEEEKAYQKRYKIDNEQLLWYRYQKALYKDKFAQEFASNATECFLSSGANVFEVAKLQEIETSEPIMKYLGGSVWEKPFYGEEYVIGVDPSLAVGRDECAIDVIRVSTGEQVFHHSGQIPMLSLVELVSQIAEWYNDAFIVPEVNNNGVALLQGLVERKKKVYKRRKFGTIKAKQEEKLGWLTTEKSKALLISGLIKALYEEEITIHNYKTITQMISYLYDENGHANAAQGKKDDCVMSLMLAWQGVLEKTRHTKIGEKKSYNSFSF